MIELDFEESFHLGLDATHRGDFGKAIEYFKHCLQVNGESGQVCHMLGACYAQIGMYDRAKDCLTRAVDADPTQFIAIFQLGLLHLTSGDVALAQESWRGLAGLSPTHPLHLFGAGMEALVADRFGECIELLRQGIAANPNPAGAALNADMQKVIDSAEAALHAGGTAAASSEVVTEPALNSLFLANYQKLTEKKH